MDTSNYFYTPVESAEGVPLIVECVGALVTSGPVELSSFLLPLLRKLRLRRPDWQLVVANQRSRVSRAQVCQDGLPLGQVRVTCFRGGDAYEIIDRFGVKRCLTGKLNKALKVISERFHPPTAAQQLAGAAAQLHNGICMHMNSARNTFNQAYNTANLRDFVVRNWDALESRSGMPEEGGHIAPTYAAMADAEKVASAPGWVVFIREATEEYFVASLPSVGASANAPHVTYTTDTLPPWIAKKLGMLKISGAGVVVPDIGFRLNSTSFFLLGEEGETV